MADDGPEEGRLGSLLGRLATRRPVVTGSAARLRSVDLQGKLKALGVDGPLAYQLDKASDAEMGRLRSLSTVTESLAVDYIDRLGRPIPTLTPAIGVQVMARSYLAHMAVERDASSFGAEDVPVLGTLPPLRKGRTPQDLLSQVVKASRRNFEMIRAVSTPVWDGFVLCLTKRAHDMALDDASFVEQSVVDGVAKVGWVLRQVDIHYELSADLR